MQLQVPSCVVEILSLASGTLVYQKEKIVSGVLYFLFFLRIVYCIFVCTVLNNRRVKAQQRTSPSMSVRLLGLLPTRQRAEAYCLTSRWKIIYKVEYCFWRCVTCVEVIIFWKFGFDIQKRVKHNNYMTDSPIDLFQEKIADLSALAFAFVLSRYRKKQRQQANFVGCAS